MGGRGSNSGMSSGLSKIESKIRNNSTETAALVGTDGSILFDKSDGLVGAVHFSADEVAMMQNNTLTHNHPSGTTFSHEDINLAVQSGLKEIRAVHNGGFYSLARQYQIGEQIPKKYLNFANDYKKAVSKYMSNTVDAIYNATNDANKCNNMVAEFRKQWLKNNSTSYGWNYKEG